MTRTLVPKHPLLLLLLLLPLSLPAKNKYGFEMSGFSEEGKKEFLDYLEEIYGTGPTRPPGKKKFLEKIQMEEGKYPDDHYCSDEVKFKNVHYRLRCVPEHYFLNISYEEMQNVCYSTEVLCKNGSNKCRRGHKLVEGVYCTLTSGTRMPNCEYKSIIKEGYPVITCRWNNATKDFVPDYIDNLVPAR